MNPASSLRQSHHHARVQTLRDVIAREGWAGMLVLDPADLTWLTGLSSSNAAAIITPDQLVVATDFRYAAAAATLGLEVRLLEHSMYSELGRLAGELTHGTGGLAYGPSSLTHRGFLQFTEHLPEHVMLRAVDDVVSRLRSVKDVSELDAIRRAAALLEGAYQHVVDSGLVGRTETDVAWSIERWLRENGATAKSFDFIVASGQNGAFAHHSPAATPIERDTLVTIDIGCVVDGYCSDCTRTFATGSPSDDLLTIYDVTLRAQLAALTAVAPGAVGRDVDAIARDIISGAGYGEYFGHGLGHGVGAEVHEAPRLSKLSEDVLEQSMVVTVEPGIYLPGVGGVRIEDLTIVTADGHEVLTGFTKELVTVH